MHRVLQARTERGTLTVSSTDEQVLNSNEFPAYFWQPGKVVRASFAATSVDENSTNTAQIRIRFGATAVGGTLIAQSAAVDQADGDVHVAQVEIVCRSVDADGVGTFYAKAAMNDPDATGTVGVDGYAVAEIGSIDTTAATYLGYNVIFSAAHADNEMACDYALVEEIS